MSEQQRDYLYTRFEEGDIPSSQDFKDVIDSSLNYRDDGLTNLKTDTPTGTKKWFGINCTPDTLLTIQGDTANDEKLISMKSTDGARQWNINLNPTNNDVPGFSIDDATSGVSTSRIFIDPAGNVGVGTTTPQERFHIVGSNDGGNVSAQITNIQTGHNGWLLSHIDDNTLTSHNAAFVLHEKVGTTRLERITVLAKSLSPTGSTLVNTGVNEPNPRTTFQVSRSASDPLSNVGTTENSGIVLVGPIIGENLALDSSRIQARTGDYVGSGPTIALVPSSFGIQPLGGEVIVHGDQALSQQLIISTDGLVGLGANPAERLVVNGAVTLGDSISETPAAGTVRWHTNPDGTKDLMVFNGTVWKSLTTQTVTDGFWTAGAIAGSIYYEPAEGNARVAIGTTSTTNALVVDENQINVRSGISTVLIKSEAQTSDAVIGTVLNRAGLEINTSGLWSNNEFSSNIGLFVSNVSGQTNVNLNLAAVLNGSTVIGNVTGLPMVGANGTNVLAIQDGVAPISIPGTTANSGIQVFSTAIDMSGIDTSVFNVMTGDGEVIQLYQQPTLTPAANVNAPNTGNIETNELIDNIRLRVNKLEEILKNLNLLPNV